MTFLNLEIGGSRIVITRRALYYLALWLFLVFWYSEFLPVPFLLPILVIISLAFLARNSSRTIVRLPESTTAILQSLNSMRDQAAAAARHAERLVTELHVQQVELEQKTALTKSLAKEIDSQLKEYDSWRNLGEEEKRRVIEAAREALTKRTLPQTVGVVLGSVVLNLVASVVWVLIGSPGKSDLEKLLEWFK